MSLADLSPLQPNMVLQDFFYNPNADRYRYQVEAVVSPTVFHAQLPNFRSTPLTDVSGHFPLFDHVFIKDESQRLGLPSFKILGASWGVFRCIAKKFDLPLDSNLQTVQKVAQEQAVHLVTATDGNHGRAIAYMARLLGVQSTVFVPATVNDYTQDKIRGEGAQVIVETGDYDTAVKTAYQYSQRSSSYLFIQDTSFDGYHEIPAWIVQGYTTMLEEVETQLKAIGLSPTHVITPVGVGSLAHAVVAHCKSQMSNITVIAVESELAACLQASLRSGASTPISTKMTIMDGVNCGTVSDISWPILKDGIDAAMTITDRQSHKAVVDLSHIGVNAGPCGASTSAALRQLIGLPHECEYLGLKRDSVVVLLCTEGPREYVIPM